MFGYLLAIGFMTAWYALCRNSDDKNHTNFLVGTAIFMTLFYGLRGSGVGSDTLSYITMFHDDGSQPIANLWAYMWAKKSPAFILAEWLFYKILPFPQLWLIATSAFFFFTFSRFIAKNSMDPFFSYFIFFTIFGTFQMTGIRQSCAMAVLLFAFEEIKNKKLIKYLLLVGLAYLFHKSAIVFLPFYFWGRRRITKMDIPILIVVLILIYQNRSFLFDYIKSFTSYDYFEQLNHGEPVNFSIMIYAATLLSIVLCVFLTIARKKLVLEQYYAEHYQRINISPLNSGVSRYIPDAPINKAIYIDRELVLYSQYANAMILSSLFMPLVAINGAVRRIVMYFALFMVLLIPKAFRELFEPRIRTVLKMVFGVILLYLLLSGVRGSSYEYRLWF